MCYVSRLLTQEATVQTVTSPEDLRRASGRAALAAARVAVLASLLVLGVASRVRAQQDPLGCSGTGLTINSPFVERANGNNAGAGSAVSPCETLLYKGSLTGGSPPACCFQGGTPIITTPRTCASNADCADNPSGTCGTEIAGRCSYDVTPPGGVPEICPGDPAIDTLTLQYQVRSQDVDVNGRITARFHFTAGESLTGT